MIPTHITKTHIAEAIQRIIRDGVPLRRRSRGYCLTTMGEHLPPKYTIARAHLVATGELLSADRFSGGQESNDFLRHRGFAVVECNCSGTVHEGRPAPESPPSPGQKRTIPVEGRSDRHTERCSECKSRIRQLLTRIYGACVLDHRFEWSTGLAAYEGTSIDPVLREVAEALTGHQGHGIRTFVRSEVLAGCDYWVPDPGFIIEFDESQHFTSLRKLALSVYADTHPLKFDARRWMELCEHHNARDSDPRYRDEQRAWYDTLRDLVPPIRGLQPTVRLYARDRAWCSFDPDKPEDRERFSDLIHEGCYRSRPTTVSIGSPAARPQSILRVAMVFPKVARRAVNGVPPSGAGAQQPDVPTADAFAGEAIDFALFPEGYISACDHERGASLSRLAEELGTPLLVGAVDKTVDSTGRAWQVILRFDPDGSDPSRVYVKHSTADAVAFELPDWEPSSVLPTFELGGDRAGATICHDQYLGLLPRFLARRGARLWVNPSFDNVTDIKWSSILRLRAVENRFFSLCTLHYDEARRRTHPFAFAPDGTELSARHAGSETARPLSECTEAGSIYVIDLDMAQVGQQLDWGRLPPAPKARGPRNGRQKPIKVALRDGEPTVLEYSNSISTAVGFRVETVHGPVFVGMVPNEQILDAAACFQAIDHAKHMKAYPIIWNHWERVPTDWDWARLATLMMGRAIECCAPILLSDRSRIHELVELTNRNKIPARRIIASSGEAIVNLGYAWGLDNAFKIVKKHVPAGMRATVLNRYRSLA